MVSGRSWCWGKVGVEGQLVSGGLVFWCGRVLDILASRSFDSGYILSVCSIGEGGKGGRGSVCQTDIAGKQRSSEKIGKRGKGELLGLEFGPVLYLQ